MRKGTLEDLQGIKFQNSPFEVYDYFCSRNIEKFLNDPVGSQLVYNFIQNHAENYLKSMPKEFKICLAKVIQKIKDGYLKVKSYMFAIYSPIISKHSFFKNTVIQIRQYITIVCKLYKFCRRLRIALRVI